MDQLTQIANASAQAPTVATAAITEAGRTLRTEVEHSGCEIEVEKEGGAKTHIRLFGGCPAAAPPNVADL